MSWQDIPDIIEIPAGDVVRVYVQAGEDSMGNPVIRTRSIRIRTEASNEDAFNSVMQVYSLGTGFVHKVVRVNQTELSA